jgi:D-serine deaminase-like pyridoxal phosphate-dependent protein
MIKKPTLVLDSRIAKENIAVAKHLCKKWDMDFRPHFKTHQSAAIAEWFRDLGVNKCCVSSVGMAQYFAKHHWENILIAIAVNVLEIDEINQLSAVLKLTLTVDHIAPLLYLQQHIQHEVDIYIEIDTSYGRSGIHHQNQLLINELLMLIKSSEKLHFAGFMSHSGNTYQMENAGSIQEVFEQSKQAMLVLKEYFLADYPHLKISLGDTPSTTFGQDFNGIDEWRPGNFIFYDLMQWQKGVCKKEQVALRVSCPVIGIYPERKEFVIYGGAVHFSKEYVAENSQNIYGKLVAVNRQQIEEEVYVVSLSQEHGIVAADDTMIAKLKMGDLVEVVPIHSCLTADLYKRYHLKNGGFISKWDGGKD